MTEDKDAKHTIYYHTEKKEAKEMWDKINRWIKENEITNQQFVGLFGERMFWAFHFGRIDVFLEIYKARIKFVMAVEKSFKDLRRKKVCTG